MSEITTLRGAIPLLAPRRYRDGEQYYAVDWEILLPQNCSLDYNSHEDSKGAYAEIYDTNTGTVIARTRSYEKEEYAFNTADRIMTHLRDEYQFERNFIWTRKV